jgi:large subunit ribosomal protein L6
MSRVGKVPVEIPSGVKISLEGSEVRVEGPKGKLTTTMSKHVSIAVDAKQVVITPVNAENRQARADYGTMRALINNMVVGVTKGFSKGLELNGVGYTAKVVGQDLILATGYSHEVRLAIPTGLTAKVEKNTAIQLECCDRQVLGNFAATVRKVRPPEPYLGKGVKYSDEVIRRKAGKTGKK